jgi:hypothetical protein
MMLIGTDDGIYRWFEGGPWPVFHSLQGQAIVGLASPGGGVIVAVDSAGRIWETINNGVDWRELPRPDGVERATSLGIWGTPAEVVMTSRPLGLYRRPIGAAIEPPPPRGLVALSRRLLRREMTRSGRFGVMPVATERPRGRDLAGWTALSVPPVLTSAVAPEIRALAIGTGEPSAWFAAVGESGLWRSDDAGASWTQCQGLPNVVYAIRTGPKGLVVAGTADGCFLSADNGQTWTEKNGGLDQARQVRAVEIKPGSANIMLAGAAPFGTQKGARSGSGGLGFALYETKDGGKTWSHVNRGFPERLESDSIADIRYNPADPDYIIVAMASGEMWNSRTDGLWWEPLARQVRAARVVCAVE